MADLDKVIKGLEHCIMGSGLFEDNPCADCPYLSKPGCSARLKQDAINILKSQQAEIKRLEQENVDLKVAIQSIPNWLDEKRPEVVHCPDCLYQKNCISTQSGIEPDGFCKWGKRKDGDTE